VSTPDPSDSLLTTLQPQPDAELVEVARRAAIGALAADVAHDIGNSVFAVLGLVDLLLADDGDDERLLLIRETGIGLRETLRALAEFVRAEAPRTPLEEVAALAVALARHGIGKHLEVDARLGEQPLYVTCPQGALRNAVLQLVVSAREAAGARGRIELVVAAEPPAAILEVSPAGPESLGLTVAAQIAEACGGALERRGERLVLRFPLET
jgi:two-component system, NtrC family, sensor histidine kinase HydH